MVDNEQSSIEEQDGEDGEERRRCSKEASTGLRINRKIIFPTRQNAVSSLANFASKANKLHSQLPEPVKEKATNRHSECHDHGAASCR
jgi:hypothetical protein